ncbi:MAG TPA: FCD domain-containing protein [Amycolatopsis sp.]|nr:FCD domain-containing protein [Amycolatopsis sp.]
MPRTAIGAAVRADSGLPAPEAGEPPEPSPGGKLASQVAHRIENDIIRLAWPIGTVLGSEQDLREKYGVSRSVLREAVRLAEHHQVARMRRGPNGGLLVCAPDAAPATRALVIYLEYIGTTVNDLMDARLLLEPLAARLAAATITEDGIEQLRHTLDDETERRNEPGTFAQDMLHVLLGELSGNSALHLFIDVLARLSARYAHTTRRISKEEAARGKADAHARHVAIADAVIAGDTGKAESATAAHLEGVKEWLLSHQPRRRGRRGAAPARQPEEPGAKLAEVIAGRIRDEIARRGWPIGQVLGSEADLLARHGVSRAALREAVRLLEYHSVALMRRGPGGGLVVTEPDPSASIETMALYLDYRGVTSEDLRVVREAVELGALAQVIARRQEPEVAARLEAAIAQGEASASVQDENHVPGPSGSDRFHTELGDLSGNPVLGLFLRILTALWTRHRISSPTAAQPGAEGAVEAANIHRRILEALLAGDEGLARHRMRRHLEALTAWYH